MQGSPLGKKKTRWTCAARNRQNGRGRGTSKNAELVGDEAYLKAGRSLGLNKERHIRIPLEKEKGAHSQGGF